MKIKIKEAEGQVLDWMVNQIEECCDDPHSPPFSTSWAQGGPIIEREKINLRYDDEDGEWVAGWECTVNSGWGDTPLIAAMRCYVASKLGDEVEVPDNLLGGV